MPKKKEKAPDTEKELHKKRLKKVRRITAIVTAALLLVCAVILLISASVYKSRMEKGDYLRREIAASNGIDISGSAMYVIFCDNYNTFAQYMDIDPTLSLKRQYTSDGSTYFELFMQIAKSDAATLLSENKAAAALSLTLTEAEKTALRNKADSYPDAAYPDPINSDDIYEVLVLRTVAAKYGEYKRSGLIPGESEVLEWLEANGTEYKLVDLLAFSVYYTDGESNTSAFDAETAEALAEDLAKAATGEDFKNGVRTIISVGTPDITAEETEEYINALALSKREYSEDNEVLKWAFSASVGECCVVHDSENLTYTVYQLQALPYTDSSPTKNFDIILMSDTDFASHSDAVAKANELHNAFLASGKDESVFALAALEYSTDSMSFGIGGAYKNVKNGIMLPELNDWIFSDKRAEGDSAVIETDGGCAVIAVYGDGAPAWKAKVTADIVKSRYADHCKALEAASPVLFDETVLDMIQT